MSRLPKKLNTHLKVKRKQIRRTVDALTQITEADPIAFLISVMQGKPFTAADPDNPRRQITQYPTREQRVLVGMYLASRIAPAAKTNAPAAGNVNVVIRSRHADEPRPQNLVAQFQQTPGVIADGRTNTGVIIDATPSEEPEPARQRGHRADPDADD